MAELLKDIVDCEIEFKRSYFGLQPRKEPPKVKRSPSLNNKSVSSLTLSSAS